MKHIIFKASVIALLSVPSLCLATFSTSNIYVSGQLGYSSSQKSDFSLSDGTGWNNPSQNIDARFGNSVMYGVALGYYILPLVRSEIAYNYRPNFQYNETFSNPATDRHRQFDIKNETLMLNVYLNAKGLKQFNSNQVDPYIGAGIGSSWNKTSNFSGYTASTGVPAPGSNPIAGDTLSSFAWQAMIGTLINITCHFNIDVGYRYLDLGKISLANHDTAGNTVGKYYTNSGQTQEVYMGVNYSF